MKDGVEQTLRALSSSAWRDRLDPVVHSWSCRVTGPEANRHDKVRVLVDEVHKRSRIAPNHRETMDSVGMLLTEHALDADEACLLVASAAMSVGIPCQFVAERYGQSWTCRLSYLVGDAWHSVDPLRQNPPHAPDETVYGPVPEVL